MAINFACYSRLEPFAQQRDFEAGFRAAVHDPAWFLARQWQMGEHQGENASSPVMGEYRLQTAQIASPVAGFDPTIMPAEAIVESELDDWWTMGRRIRLGKQLAEDQAVAGHTELQFSDPPPPYEALRGMYDGKAIWDARGVLGVAEAAFGPNGPPTESPQAWDSEQLIYQQGEATSFTAADHRLQVKRHTGGRMDWHSVDAVDQAGAGPSEVVTREVMPAGLQYPGAPNKRWWQIEDAAVDLGGYPPDSAHVPTAMLTDLIFSHSDDWFLFPVTAHAGNVVTMVHLTIWDAFGRSYTSDDYEGLRPPAQWTLFKTAGLADEALVLWHVAELPLESGAIERVQFGIDEQSNLLWAVERAVDGREVAAAPPDEEANPKLNAGRPPADATKPREYVYVPGEGIVPYWHPYEIAAVEDRRMLVLRGLTDLSRQMPAVMPPPRAEVLMAGTPEQRRIHEVVPAAVPSNGIEIERRWTLARDMDGRPVLWIQRQRKPLRMPPARRLRFDVMEEQGRAVI